MQNFTNDFQVACPSWQIFELPSNNAEWLDILVDEFGVVGNWDSEADEMVEFESDQVEVSESYSKVDVKNLAHVQRWCRDEFGDDLTSDAWDELQAFLSTNHALKFKCYVIKAQLAHCGDIVEGAIRVAAPSDGAYALIRPIDGLWQRCIDRTSGPVWEDR